MGQAGPAESGSWHLFRCAGRRDPGPVLYSSRMNVTFMFTRNSSTRPFFTVTD